MCASVCITHVVHMCACVSVSVCGGHVHICVCVCSVDVCGERRRNCHLSHFGIHKKKTHTQPTILMKQLPDGLFL